MSKKSYGVPLTRLYRKEGANGPMLTGRLGNAVVVGVLDPHAEAECYILTVLPPRKAAPTER